MDDAAISTATDPTGVQAVYPFFELAPALEHLDVQLAGLARDTEHLVREGGATLDALIAETDLAFTQLRHAHQVTRELDDEQAAEVLRGIREHAGVTR